MASSGGVVIVRYRGSVPGPQLVRLLKRQSQRRAAPELNRTSFHEKDDEDKPLSLCVRAGVPPFSCWFTPTVRYDMRN